MSINITCKPIIIFISIVLVLSCFALVNYPGNGMIYIFFTILLNILLINGFIEGKIYFDTFIGIFFWLGFWLKLTIRVAFLDGKFHEPTGTFSGTGAEYDHALIVTSFGILAMIAASYIRKRFIFKYPKNDVQFRLDAICGFYRHNKKPILVLFTLLILIIAVTNALLGIYQRGSASRTILPFGFNGVYTWLVLFGLTSFSTVLLDCEFRINKNPYLVSIITLFECFLSSISMLSRGMIINAGTLIIAAYENIKRHNIISDLRYKATMITVLILLFPLSVIVVNHMRAYTYSGSTTFKYDKLVVLSSKVLFIDRWVGIEGVMAVSSYPDKGWGIWQKAWQEGYSDYGTSLYDRTFITSPYINIDNSKYHFISLPGIVAFFYYPGSYLFLFISMFLIALLAAGIEMSIYKLFGANVMLCALIAQVVAYRYAHFGYVPKQSYLLFGTIYLNMLIIWLANKILSYWNVNSICIKE